MLKISAVYFMWNPEICQDPPICGQDDLVLLIHFYINQGIAVIFQFFSLDFFQKLLNVPLRLFRTLEYLTINKEKLTTPH